MRRTLTAAAVLCSALFAPAATFRETWDAGYGGGDASGPHVLGYWKFDPGAELKDSSGKGRDLTNHGTALVAQGRFGGALESFPGFPVEDKPHSLQTAAAGLSPKGAFTIELWIAAKPDFQPAQRCFVLDKKYVSDDDYQWTLGEADKAGLRRMTVNLGFGAQSRAFYSDPLKLEPGGWRHLAFTYDAKGAGRFFVDGQAWGGGVHPGAKAISAGRKPLALGDRLGSNYGGFPGFIDEVRICDGVLEFERVKLSIESSREVFRRMDTPPEIRIRVANLERGPLTGAKLLAGIAGVQETTLDLPAIGPGAEHTVTGELDTRLKAGKYRYRARFEATEPQRYSTETALTLQMVNRPPALRMPVVMWGNPGPDFTLLKDLGFTHCLGLSVDYAAIWQAGQPVAPKNLAEQRRTLDRALAADVGLIASVSPASFLEKTPEFLRVDRAGKPYERKDICASLPQFSAYFENVGKSVAQAFGDHPAFTAALINTEVRDSSRPSFNAVDVANYRAFSGGEIPPEVNSRSGVNWQKQPNFPADRVIADDDPILKYYRWFWTVGDGWNGLHTALHKGVQTAGRKDVWTFFDPAVRAPSISGSGGDVDVLSHWTYTYPDPQRIGLATDQLMEMSRVNGHYQSVMKMTQLIWYRSQTAPPNAPVQLVREPVAWEDHDPDAAYITIAPMHLREALWTKLSRTVSGIMYHGWGSLVENAAPSAYRFTNEHTQHELKRLVREVVEPLGPTLLQVGGVPADVAFLESFTSQMFAGRGGYGSNLGWSADVWLALQHAHIPCEIIYEESLAPHLDKYRILVAPECDVLPRSVVDVIQKWQDAGGILIGDEFLCPALKPKEKLSRFQRNKQAFYDKVKTLQLATHLRRTLRPLLPEDDVRCESDEVILRKRAYGSAQYIFAINDQREFGTYVGQHGLVMENGVATRTRLAIYKPNAAVYDLTRSRAIPLTNARMELELGPAEGRVFLALDEPIAKLRIDVPKRATNRARQVNIGVAIEGASGRPVPAVIPLLLSIRDPNGRLAEGSGYYGVKDGVLSVPLAIAPNDDLGTWEVSARELASGEQATAFFTVADVAEAFPFPNDLPDLRRRRIPSAP